MTPPGQDTNPSQVSSQQTLVLINLPWKDRKLSYLRRKRWSHKFAIFVRAGINITIVVNITIISSGASFQHHHRFIITSVSSAPSFKRRYHFISTIISSSPSFHHYQRFISTIVSQYHRLNVAIVSSSP